MESQEKDFKRVTVVVVDDHPMFRDGLGAMIEAEDDLELVGEAGTGEEALEMIPRLRPVVVLVDLVLPDVGGIEIIRQITEKFSDISFLVLTSLVGDEEIYRALDAGARGYLFKDMARKELIHAIRMVAKGQRFIPDRVGAKIAEHYPRSSLSPREIEVLQCVAAGMRSKEIGEKVGCSDATVNAHMKHILEKLNAFDRTSAVLTALRRGIIRL